MKPASFRRRSRHARPGWLRPLLERLESRLPPGDTVLGMVAARSILPPLAPDLEPAVYFDNLDDAQGSDPARRRVSRLTRPASLQAAGHAEGTTAASTVVHQGTWPFSETMWPGAPLIASASIGLTSGNAAGLLATSPHTTATLPGDDTSVGAPISGSASSLARSQRFGNAPTTIETEFPEIPFPNGSSGARMKDPTTSDVTSSAEEAYGALPFYFEQNAGQAGADLDFVARGPGYTLGLKATEAIISIPSSNEASSPVAGARGWSDGRETQHSALSTQHSTVRMQIVGGDPNARAAGVSPLVTKVNYFLGNDPNEWHTNIPTFAKVQYDDVYPGIDLVYYALPPSPLGRGDGGEGNGAGFEYDFIVAPGADPNQIQLSFTGADSVTLDAAGNLNLQAGDTRLRQNAPYIYQEVNGGRRQVAGAFSLRTQHSALSTFDVSFNVGDYDSSRPLIIDPMVLSYSTYYGGSNGDYATDVAVDQYGSAYVTGLTTSLDFPDVNAYQPEFGGIMDAFVMKLSPSGQAVEYASYLGGSIFDRAHGIAVDSAGAAYVTGVTESVDFPSTPDAFQPDCYFTFKCSAGFVTKLSPDGSSLVYSTFLDGIDLDSGDDIAVDASGHAFIKGWTNSPDFPTLNAVQPDYGGGGECNDDGGGNYYIYCTDAFVTKLNPAGSALVYSTFLGGNKNESFAAGYGGMAVDAAGYAYVSGQTSSKNFPIFNPVQSIHGGGSFDAFATKLSPDGSTFVFSTYLGGKLGDVAEGIATDNVGNAYVAGYTASTEFPTTPGAFQPNKPGDTDGFVSVIRPNGSNFVYSTYLGGTHIDRGQNIAVDAGRNAYITGYTGGNNFPIVNAFQPVHGGSADAFVTKLSPQGNVAKYSSYLGGPGGEFHNYGIAVDRFNNAYIVGQAVADFPIVNAVQPIYGGGGDAFVTKVSHMKRATPTQGPVSAG